MKNKWQTLWSDPRFNVSFIFIIVIFSLCFLAPMFGLSKPEVFQLDFRLCDVSSTHWLGCDQNGNDIFNMLLYGGRISLAIGVLSVLLGLSIGVSVGLMSGYFGGALDSFVMRVLDIFLAFPGIILALFLSAALGPRYENIVLAIGLTGWMGVARLVRGEVLSLREREHVLAAKMTGASDLRVMIKHILPLTYPLLLVHSAFSISGAIIAESSLSFLGLAPQTEISSWGGLLGQGKNLIVEVPLIAIAPGVAMTLTIICLNLMGDSLRDYFDPQSHE